MILYPNNKLFISLFIYVLLQDVFAFSDVELLAKAEAAFTARKEAKSPKSARVLAFKKSLEGLSDTEKIRAIALRVFSFDDDPKHKMRWINAQSAATALYEDPNLITDVRGFREMISKENDPRKFYLLSNIVSQLDSSNETDFIEEHHRMLFEDGAVARPEGEYTDEFFFDVSIYAYRSIVGSLKRKGVNFPEPASDLTHEEKATLLDQWLVEEFFPKRERRKERISSTMRHKSSLITNTEETVKGESSRVSKWVYIALLIFLLAVSFYLFKNKTAKG